MVRKVQCMWQHLILQRVRRLQQTKKALLLLLVVHIASLATGIIIIVIICFYKLKINVLVVDLFVGPSNQMGLCNLTTRPSTSKTS